MDPKLIEALDKSVLAAGQSPALARKLAAWVNAVASGNEDINDAEAAGRHLDVIYAAVALPDDAQEGDASDGSIQAEGVG